MKNNTITNFFDSEIQRTAGENGCNIYNFKNSTGIGVITQYELMPGINIFYNDFHMKDGKNENKLPQKDTIEINHCREGRFECEFENGDYQYIGAGDLSIHRLTRCTKRTSFPFVHFHGISITINIPEATKTISELESIIGKLDINIESIINRLCDDNSFFVLRGSKEIEHIFSELYSTSPETISHYAKIKILELLMYLNDMTPEDYVVQKRYFQSSQVKTIHEMQKFMIKNIGHHYTLRELSEIFDIPLTSMKSCFKGVYGTSIYSYMKAYRMQSAALMLKLTSDNVTEVAAKMGYDNPSKFTESFKKQFGCLPSEYKRR